MRRIILGGLLFVMSVIVVGCGVPQKETRDATAHYILGQSYLAQKSPAMALKEFQEAALINPDKADLQEGIALAYQLQQAYPQAEEHFKRALQLNHDDPQTQNNLAALYLDMHRWNDAIRYFKLASSNLTFARQDMAMAGLGYAYSQKKDYTAARAAYQKALNMNPSLAQAHFGLGQTYEALGKIDQGITEYQQALSEVPDYTAAHYRLALAFMKKKDNEEARAHFEEVLRLAPDSDLGRRAAIYLKLLK